MAEMVWSALIQETVSRGVSLVLGKRKDNSSSQEQIMERLEMAANELELAVERSAKLPITDVSLFQRRKMIKRGYAEAKEQLDKHKPQAVCAGQQEEKHPRWMFWAKDDMPSTTLSTDDVRRFEWYADCASKFLRDVESGCSLRHYTFCNPIVRHLLEGKTLRYYHLEQGNLQRNVIIWPAYSDERGVEAMLQYRYDCSSMNEKSFCLLLFLRLSESTDIVGVAIKGLQLLTPEFKLATEFAMGELTLLSNLQDIAHSYGAPAVGYQEHYTNDIRFLRPDPACCKENRHGLCSNNIISSELSDIFAEQVIYWGFQCYYAPALEPSIGGGKPPLVLTAAFAPHEAIEMEDSYALEIIRDIKEYRDASIQQVVGTLKSNAISRFFRQPELTEYKIFWRSKHGGAGFGVKMASMAKTGLPKNRRRYNTCTRSHKETSQEAASHCGFQEYLVGSFVAIYGGEDYTVHSCHLPVMEEMVWSALVQEAISRGISFGFSRREEKASQGHLMERLQMAASELELALERSAKLPITDIALLQRRKTIKRAYAEAMEQLNKHKQQVVPGAQQDIAQGAKRKRWAIGAKNLFRASSSGLNTDDVRRFEWFADCAGKFLRDVESCCSLHYYTFCSPIARHLLEGKTLEYKLKQGNQLRSFYTWSTFSEERGVEAVLEYSYEDSTMPEKCFYLLLVLRLSESIDMVQVANKGLEYLTSQFHLPAEFAMRELTLLRSNLQDCTNYYVPPWVGNNVREWRIKQNQHCLPDPACCKANRHARFCASNNISSELSDIFPEEVIFLGLHCYTSALEPTTTRSGRSLLLAAVTVGLMPHCGDDTLELQGSYAIETMGNVKDYRDATIQQVARTLKSDASSCFLHQPEGTKYEIDCYSKHGGALFRVEKVNIDREGAPSTASSRSPTGLYG